jgi:hypothetical protein
VARCPSCTDEIRTGRRARGELRRIGKELRLVLGPLADRHMARRADRLSVVPSASGGRFWDEPL